MYSFFSVTCTSLVYETAYATSLAAAAHGQDEGLKGHVTYCIT